MSPPKRRKRRLLLLVPLFSVVAYVAIFLFVPGFDHATFDTLAQLGIYQPRYDPGHRDLVQTPDGPMLWGGPRDADHFDITPFRLEVDQLHYGLGRERFPALIEPAFLTMAEAEADFADVAMGLSLDGDLEKARRVALEGPRWPGRRARVLVVRVDDAVRIYPLDVLRRHELVNDVVGERPIFVAYCYLANLAAAYDRRIRGHVLTFAVSGYTYHDPAVWDDRDAFVLWDRDTESLWWPPIGRAVSGPLIDTSLPVLDEALWAQMTWGEARDRFPEALVLAPDQSHTPPESWPRLTELGAFPTSAPDAGSGETRDVAPRWGLNSGL